MKTFFKTMRRYNLSYRGFLFFYVSVSVVVAVCAVLINKLSGDISQAALSFDTDVLVGFLATMAAITAVNAVTAAVGELIKGRYSGRAGFHLREAYARHLAYIRFADFEKKNSGAALSLYTNDLPQTVSFLTEESLKLIADIISVLASFVFMVSINPIYTLIFILMFPLLIFMQAKISTPIQKKAIVISTERARFNADVNDSLQNTAAIVAYSLEDYMEKRYLASYDRYFSAMKDYIKSLVVLVMSGIVATMLPILFICVAAGLSVANGRMSISEFIAFTSVAGTAGGWLSMLSQNLRTLRVTPAGAERLNESMSEPVEDINSGAAATGKSDIAIRFDNVSFAYADSPILKDVSFQIKKGGKTAIVGASGSGKSSVLKLIVGLYEPGGGDIFILSQNAKDISKKALRDGISYVPQDGFVFPCSIRENIVLAEPDGGEANNIRLKQACADAGILEFIESLPEGFNAVLSEAAGNISGGQRQRIAVARAFYKDAPLVLLDEATSSLDSITEDALLTAFNALMQGRTAVVVAHRPKAIAACDTIIVMDKGRVAGIGSHGELTASCPEYTALYENLVSAEREEREGYGNENLL